jgi:hypothetical protein
MSQFSMVAEAWEEGLKHLHSTMLETEAAARVIEEVVIQEDLKEGVLLHQSDNTTTVSYLNKQGGRVKNISQAAERVWNLCLERGITLQAVYKPGVEIKNVDFLSRIPMREGESMLPTNVFEDLNMTLGPLKIDLFATRFNCQLKKFVSLYPDPLAWRSDAFSFHWKSLLGLYVFPPFNMIGRILAKVMQEQAQIVIVIPNWTGATWWPMLIEMQLGEPMILGNVVWNWKRETMMLKWPLHAWRVSGKT